MISSRDNHNINRKKKLIKSYFSIMTTLAGGVLVTNYHDDWRKVSKSSLHRGKNKRDHYVKQLLMLGMGDHQNFLFVSFLSDKTIERSFPFSSEERPKDE